MFGVKIYVVFGGNENRMYSGYRGVFRGGGHWARIAKLNKKGAKLRHGPPPFASWASGFQALAQNHLILGEKWDET